MTYRYLQYRGLMVGAFLVAAPIVDVLAGGASAGLMHIISSIAGATLLAVSMSLANRPRDGLKQSEWAVNAGDAG